MQTNATVQKTRKNKPTNDVHLESLRRNGELKKKGIKKAIQARKATRSNKRGIYGRA